MCIIAIVYSNFKETIVRISNGKYLPILKLLSIEHVYIIGFKHVDWHLKGFCILKLKMAHSTTFYNAFGITLLLLLFENRI